MQPGKEVDKSKWPRGEWNDEPDFEDWTDKSTGLACAIRRGIHGGHLCGYVGVPAGHRAFGESGWESSVIRNLDVHCGVTFAQTLDDGLHWIGFDCAHLGDATPAWGWTSDGFYKSIEFVRRQCADLAQQLASLTNTVEDPQ